MGIPEITDDEVKAFFKFRDSEEDDNYFKSEDDFFKYLQTNIGAFANNQDKINKFREDLKSRREL